jgi:GTP-binding protein LepA
MNQTKIRNFCIIAHVDHGKSTLADRFLELTKTVEVREMKEQYLDRMDLERERGITIKLQPVRMLYKMLNDKLPLQSSSGRAMSNLSHLKQVEADQIQNPNGKNNKWKLKIENLKLSDSEYILNLIDTPGHVDFSYEVSRSLAACEGAVLLVDATQGIQAQTLANLYQAQKLGLTIIPVINKIDLPNADLENSVQELASLLKIDENEIIKVSAKTGKNVNQVLDAIVEKVKSPSGNIEKPLRALIFDSNYDPYRGVVAYVRIIDGFVKRGSKIKLIETKISDESLEVGYFAPDYTAKDSLDVGEIGYIVTGLKQVSECRVGDTITLNDASVEPLPGYKEPVPMVFAGIYTVDGEVNKLREGLQKLKLNDASLTFEPESSKAFGFGFRSGFLGTLHLEIVKERLEREYNLNLVITTPQVAYKEKNVSGRSEFEEPWAKVEIVTPEQHIGSLMELLKQARGIYKSTKYLSDKVVLEYETPLASIIVNFYDKLKSYSSGYASMNYDLIGYRSGNLVKMDVLIAGEKIDVLAQIVDRGELVHKAQFIVKRLKDLIPRQMFEVSIQAAVGGKILARENIPAMKKDVTGYLYGGDITRKRKLWEKQKEGKKKMKKLGRVDIPTDVFIKLLKY